MAKRAKRLSFAKVQDRVPLPDLLAVQLNSYKYFLQLDKKDDERENSGLEAVFRHYFPCESNDGNVVVEYVNYKIGDLKYTQQECFDKNLTYSVPIRAVFRLIIKKTWEVKETDIYIGDFPYMTDSGTFIINGAERVVVSQIYKSPGVLFSKKAQEFSSKIVPGKGSWLEFILDEAKDVMFVRIDSRRKIPVTMFLHVLGMDLEYIVSNFFEIDKINLKELDIATAVSDLVGRYSAEKVLDSEGNIIVNAMEKLFPNTITQLYQKDKPSISLITLDSLEKNHALVNTLEKDDTKGSITKAIKKIYNILHPGEAAPIENIKAEIQNMFFSPKMYNLGKVGRYKLVLKLYPNLDKEEQEMMMDQTTLSFDDITLTLKYLLAVSRGEALLDDIDHLGNRRVRNVNELLQNQLMIAFAKVERFTQEKMSSKEIEELSPQSVINIKPIISSINDFFGMSQLSQFMDQTNPISELTHKRRLSALGPGGLSRDRAGLEARDVHNTHYGRVCPIETPEGPNIGLIVSLANFAQINDYGFIETPHMKVKDGIVLDEAVYMSATEEENYYIAQASELLDEDNKLISEFPQVLHKTEFELAPRDKVQMIDVSPVQILSVSASLIPFIEHDDANRALMGSNMQRQGVPLLKSTAPIVGTGMEYYVARDSRSVITAKQDFTVTQVDARKIKGETKDGILVEYPLIKFRRTNHDTCFTQKPIVNKGEVIEKGDIIADGFASEQGDLALGKNITLAFMPWNGYNYEDAVLLSEKVLKDDGFTSIHLSIYEGKVLETKLGSEELTNEIPNVGEDALRNLDDDGIIRVGSYVKSGDILMGKVTPKGEPTETPEFRLLHAIFGEKAKDVRDTSLRVPHGESGVVLDVKVFDIDNDDDLPAGVLKLVKIYVAQKRKIRPGDKIAGRHGNKGVISRVLPEEDMPFLPDGTPVDMVLNPLGVPSRMNIGQIFETLLGYAGLKLETKYTCSAFQGGTLEEIFHQYDLANEKIYKDLHEERAKYDETTEEIDTYYDRIKLNSSGKYILRDGVTGEKFTNEVFVGVMYMMKLHHMVDDKLHARSVGPYSLVTQQPLRGKANFGGQRLGEMEVWALEAYGAANLLQEMMTVKSDGTEGRVAVYEGLVKNKYAANQNIPESFNVLVQELRGLALDIQVYDKTGKRLPLSEKEKEMLDMKIYLI